MSKARSSDPFH